VNCGVKGVKAKGWGSCGQTRDKGGWEFVTPSKEAGSPSKKYRVILKARFFSTSRIIVYL
jgi:hypothetical protein